MCHTEGSENSLELPGVPQLERGNVGVKLGLPHSEEVGLFCHALVLLLCGLPAKWIRPVKILPVTLCPPLRAGISGCPPPAMLPSGSRAQEERYDDKSQ